MRVAFAIETKVCSTCRVQKSVSEFHRNARRKDGYHNQCRDCRGTKTPRHKAKPTEVRSELNVWCREFERVCRCIVCNRTPVLPASISTVDQARDYVRANAPRCADHLDGSLPLKARLKAKHWTEHAAETVATIDLYHLITVVLKNFPHERRVAGAKAWLAGQREGLEDAMVEFIEGWIERTSDRAVVASLNETAPIITAFKRQSIRDNELSAEELDEKRRARLAEEGDEDDFNSIIDEVLLTRDDGFDALL